MLPLFFATYSFAEDSAPSQCKINKQADCTSAFDLSDPGNLDFKDCVLDIYEDDDVTHTERKNASLKMIRFDHHLLAGLFCLASPLKRARTTIHLFQLHLSLIVFLGVFRL